MKKLLALAVLVTGFMAGSAHAATLDVTLGASPVFTNGPAFLPNVSLPNPILTLDNNSQIIAQGVSSSNFYTALTGVPGNYLAVLGLNPTLTAVDEGISTFTLGGNLNQFGLAWGTIDSYNTLTITDAGHVFSFTGTDILNHIAGSIAGQTQANVLFTDPFGPIITAQLSSTSNTFEAGAFIASNSNTPLPAALPMFAAALCGLLFFAWRSRQAKI